MKQLRQLNKVQEQCLAHLVACHVSIRAIIAAALGRDPNEIIRVLTAADYVRAWPYTLGDLSAYTLGRRGCVHLSLPISRCQLPGPQALTQRLVIAFFCYFTCTNFRLVTPASLAEDFGSVPPGLWLVEQGRRVTLFRVYAPCEDTRISHALRHLVHLEREMRSNEKVAEFLDKRWVKILVLTNQHKKTAIEEALAVEPYAELFENRTTVSVRTTPTLLTIPEVVRKGQNNAAEEAES